MFVSRYVTRALTTPLLLLGLAFSALDAPLRRRRALVAGLLGADVFMVVTGLAAALSPAGSPEKWTWYLVSSGAFLAVLYVLWGGLRAEAEATGARHRWLFTRNATFLTAVWLVYPLNFLLGEEGLRLYGSTTSTAAYTLLDLTAKAVYGVSAVAGVKALVDGAEPPHRSLDEQARLESPVVA